MFDYPEDDVESSVIHENYYEATMWNDVALLFLKKPFKVSPNISPICLPPQGHNFDYNRCIVSGWGNNAFGEAGKFQNILQYVQVPIVSHQECQRSLKSTNILSNRFQLHESFICAGGEEGNDACRGDGGSPLICPISNKKGYYYQAGIVSWGLEFGNKGVPGFYVKVSKFRNWIDGKLNEHGLLQKVT